MANYPGMPFTERRLSVFFAVTSSVVTWSAIALAPGSPGHVADTLTGSTLAGASGS
jgi:hypothetical protein